MPNGETGKLKKNRCSDIMNILVYNRPPFYSYSRISRKRSPGKFERMAVTRAGRLRERVLVRDCSVKQLRVVACQSFRNSLITREEREKKTKLMFNDCLYT